MTAPVVKVTLGLDTSAVDGTGSCDWAAAKAGGARFVYLKRAQNMHEDACYARDSDAARKAGLHVGAYVFPNCGLTAQPPKTQVAAWKVCRGDVIAKIDLPVALDIESTDWAANGRTKKDTIETLRQFVLELHDQFGAWPMVYTSYNQWYSLGLPDVTWGVKCPLWIKTAYRLPAQRPVDQVTPPTPHVGIDAHDPRNYYRIPDPWKTTGASTQQFQGDAVGFPGMSKTVDMDRFNTLRLGSKDPFVMWVCRVLGVQETADFDFTVKNAVIALQTTNGLDVDGIVGPGTFARLAWMNT